MGKAFYRDKALDVECRQKRSPNTRDIATHSTAGQAFPTRPTNRPNLQYVSHPSPPPTTMAPSTRCHISLHKPPEKTILPHPFNHRVDLVLPTNLYLLFSNDLHSSPLLKQPPLCHRLCTPLLEILKTGFLTKYIKTGSTPPLTPSENKKPKSNCQHQAM